MEIEFTFIFFRSREYFFLRILESIFLTLKRHLKKNVFRDVFVMPEIVSVKHNSGVGFTFIKICPSDITAEHVPPLPKRFC